MVDMSQVRTALNELDQLESDIMAETDTDRCMSILDQLDAAENAVGVAFYEATKDYNRLKDCMNPDLSMLRFMRRMAHQDETL